jgi:D-alanyl-D-alanine carboxypeptidase
MKYLALIFLFVATTVLAREPSVYVYNETTDRVEHQRNSTEFRSIASITKLMTAMVALDHSKDLFRRLPLNTTVKSNLPRGSYTTPRTF